MNLEEQRNIRKGESNLEWLYSLPVADGDKLSKNLKFHDFSDSFFLF